MPPTRPVVIITYVHTMGGIVHAIIPAWRTMLMPAWGTMFIPDWGTMFMHAWRTRVFNGNSS